MIINQFKTIDFKLFYVNNIEDMIRIDKYPTLNKLNLKIKYDFSNSCKQSNVNKILKKSLII